jgi:hypothetical protein
MLTLPLTLMLAALVCFVVALLVAVSAIGGNFDAWLAGGFVAAVLSMLVAPFAPRREP